LAKTIDLKIMSDVAAIDRIFVVNKVGVNKSKNQCYEFEITS
jgi:hypothetical protein